MAGPIKPKGRDYPLSMTPEPVNSLSLSRANALERRTPAEKLKNISKNRDANTYNNGKGFNTDRADNDWKQYQSAKEEAKRKDLNLVAKNLESTIKKDKKYKNPIQEPTYQWSSRKKR